MKRAICLITLLLFFVLFVFADTQLGRTEGTLSDNSFVIQAYYKGATVASNMSIELSFVDVNNRPINHDEQGGTSGTTVGVNDRHVGSTETIFTWEMTGKNGKSKTVQLTFSFSTLQAELNGRYYRPTYTLSMQQNKTVNNSNNSELTDSFYKNSTTRVVGDGTTTGLIGDSDTEYGSAGSISYQGKISTNKFYDTYTWKRSGTCYLNISDYNEDLPGSYHYVCWVIAEFSVT